MNGMCKGCIQASQELPLSFYTLHRGSSLECSLQCFHKMITLSVLKQGLPIWISYSFESSYFHKAHV